MTRTITGCRRLSARYRLMAEDHGAAVFDAGSVARVGPLDGVHLDAAACASLGAALADVVRALFEGAEGQGRR
jgi:hypothetical protein